MKRKLFSLWKITVNCNSLNNQDWKVFEAPKKQ